MGHHQCPDIVDACYDSVVESHDIFRAIRMLEQLDRAYKLDNAWAYIPLCWSKPTLISQALPVGQWWGIVNVDGCW